MPVSALSPHWRAAQRDHREARVGSEGHGQSRRDRGHRCDPAVR